MHYLTTVYFSPRTERTVPLLCALSPSRCEPDRAPTKRFRQGPRGLLPELGAPQSESVEMSATPRVIQCDGGSSLGSRRNITKLVEWPVVESVPLRAVVR